MVHAQLGPMKLTADTPEELHRLLLGLSRVLTDKEMAEIAVVTERTIVHWRAQGDFPHHSVRFWQFATYEAHRQERDAAAGRVRVL